MPRCLLLFLRLILVCLFVGCSGAANDRWTDKRPAIVAVSGVVTLDQKPLSGAIVSFSPESDGTSTAKPGASAQTDSTGRFKLTTFKEGDGVPPGRYQISVKKIERKMIKPGDGGAIAPVYEEISEVAPKFANPATSELTATVDKPTKDIVLNVTAN
ncbi:MAG: hypothetical protein JWP89_4183 [Schlesneria sp.]|nr:hypothetical protein [Schlesneria sp.]